MVFEYFFEFSKNFEKCGFCEYCACFNADSEACGCGIDMIDGALETLDLTLSKRVMFGFASGFLADDKCLFWMNDPNFSFFFSKFFSQTHKLVELEMVYSFPW